MKTFSELLTIYVRRAGITDSELARSIGVSRQTIFRWREGTTSRPQDRNIVIAVAEKLRLSSEEKDGLLLAGGFPPETVVTTDKKEPPQQIHDSPVLPQVGGQQDNLREKAPAAEPAPQTVKRGISKKYLWGLIPAGALIIAILFWIFNGNPFGKENNPGPSNPSTPQTTQAAASTTPTASSSTTIAPAAPGEILIVVTQFFEPSDTSGFNINLKDAIEREIRNNRLTGIRVAQSEVSSQNAADTVKISQDTKVTSVVYGKWDNTQISVRFLPALTQTISVISIDATMDLTQTTRALALTVLGKVYIEQGNKTLAFGFLTQARNVMQDNVPTGTALLSVINELLSQTM